MAKRNYPKIGVVDFGSLLLQTGDLDPVYIALNGMSMDRAKLARWLIAYWCFYSCGSACFLSEFQGDEFWARMLDAANNDSWSAPSPLEGKRWPRGVERRHFRGLKALDSVSSLYEKYGYQPENMIDFLVSGPSDVGSVIERAKTHLMFGDWMGFKVADMIDGVVGVELDQTDVSVFLYDTPRKSILTQWRKSKGLGPEIISAEETTYPSIGDFLEERMNWLLSRLNGLTVPHKLGKPLDNFCLETIWCKHHSHMSGHYPLWNDIDEITKDVKLWTPHSQTAVSFLENMPSRGPQDDS